MSKKTRGRIITKDSTPEAERRWKIAIAIPSRGTYCYMDFAYCLANLTGNVSAALVANDIADFMVSVSEGTYIDTNRNDLTGICLSSECDYILWLDDDMIFPADALTRLLAHNVPVVGANYPTRKLPLASTAIKTIGLDGEGTPERVQTRPEDTGLERVEAVGFGCTLIKAQVFWDVGFPWFESHRHGEDKQWVGEDVDFCIKARAAGHDVFVDHGLSHEVRHIGQMKYSVAHAVAYGDEHGTDNVRGTEDNGGELAESHGRDDDGSSAGLHLVGGSDPEPARGDS